MKKLIFMLAVVMVSQMANAQQAAQSDVPPAVKETFKKLHPAVTAPEWKRKGAHYEAKFKTSDASQSVLFDDRGNMMETETEIAVQKLPASARDYVAQHYKGEQIKEASKIVNGKGVVMYEAEIKSMDLLFDANGKFISEEKEKE